MFNAIKFSHFTFTFMHLADAFIQSDLHCIQVTVLHFLSALAFPGNRTHDLGVASAMLYHLSYRKALSVPHFKCDLSIHIFGGHYGQFIFNIKSY